MAVTKKITARDLGRAFAKIIKGEPVAKELWVEDHAEEIRLWLIVEPISLEVERYLHGLTDPLYEQFPGTYFMLIPLNPCEHRGDVHQAIPSRAEQIPLRAD